MKTRERDHLKHDPLVPTVRQPSPASSMFQKSALQGMRSTLSFSSNYCSYTTLLVDCQRSNYCSYTTLLVDCQSKKHIITYRPRYPPVCVLLIHCALDAFASYSQDFSFSFFYDVTSADWKITTMLSINFLHKCLAIFIFMSFLELEFYNSCHNYGLVVLANRAQ